MTEDVAYRRPKRVGGAVPVLGHIPMILRSRFEMIERARPMGPVCELRVGPKTVYFVNDHELLARILVSDQAKYVRGVHFEKMRNCLGNGVATTSGEEHRRQRRTMVPSFSMRRHQSRMPIHRRVMWRFVNSLPEDVPYDLTGPLLSMRCEITSKSLFGQDCPRYVLDLVREATPVFASNTAIQTLDITGIYKHLPTRSNRDFQRLLGQIDEYLFSVIEARSRGPATGAEERVEADLLDALIAATDPVTGEPFSHQEVRDQVITVLLASAETSASAVSWACYELARHPRTAAACREEVLALLDGTDVADLSIGRHDLPLLRRSLMESLRLYPPAYLLSREAAEDTVLGGYHIPKGATLLYSHYGQQRDERLFSHAEEFDPDRWLESSSDEVTPDAFMPFGYGAYRCIGESMATVESLYFVAMMLVKWKLGLASNGTPKMRGNMTLGPQNLEFVLAAQKDESE